MICEKCTHTKFIKKVTESTCNRCGKYLKSNHEGGFKYCPKCSNFLGVCQKCGVEDAYTGTGVRKNAFCKICDCIDCSYKGNCVFGNKCGTCSKVARVKNCPIKKSRDFWSRKSGE